MAGFFRRKTCEYKPIYALINDHKEEICRLSPEQWYYCVL